MSTSTNSAANRGQTTPGTNDGSYAPKTNSAPATTLPPAPSIRTFPDVPLTPRDVEVLRENKGCFQDGYTPEDADKVLSQFESAQLDVFWEYHDDLGMGGDSFFAGFPRGKASLADYREIHPQAWEYLYDPESEIDPAQIPSLLAREEAQINGGELYTFSIRSGEQHCFEDRTASDGRACDNCGDEVYDSDSEELCTACVDLSMDHDDGDHDPSTGGERDHACPQCKEGVTIGEDVDGPVCEDCGEPTQDKDKRGTYMCEECQEQNTCRAEGCDEDNTGGEGFDGYCGTCADILYQHEEGEHAPGGGEDGGGAPRSDCPACEAGSPPDRAWD